MRRRKFPRNLKLRKRLIEYLNQEGYSLFDIKLTIGYAMTPMELKCFKSGFASEYERRVLNDEAFQEDIVNSLIQKMQSSNQSTPIDRSET